MLRPNAVARVVAWSCLGALTACGGGGGKHEVPIPVAVATASGGIVSSDIAAAGTVTPITTVAIKSRVDGAIVAVPVHEGAEVRRGDLLFRIDPRPFEVARDLAAANLARDEALKVKADDLLDRSKDLEAKGYISENQYADARADAQAAAAAAAADRAALANARLNIEFSELRAPIDGRVGRLLIQQGNLVKANDVNSLLTLIQMDPIYVDFAVPEHHLAELRELAAAGHVSVKLSVHGADNSLLERVGTLAFLDNTVDASTGTVHVRATLENKDRALWPGQFADVTLSLPSKAESLVVPASAVGQGPDGAFVYVVDKSNHAELRLVTVERSGRTTVAIAKGLTEGERVVTDGQSRILPGGLVVIVGGDAPAH